MFENLGNFFKRMVKTEQQKELGSKMAAKERLHLVLMQDRANVSADFLELMKQEIIDVIKKYIVVDEDAIDVRLTNKTNEDGTNGAPALYANIPIVNIKNDMMAEKIKQFEGVDFNKEMGIIQDTNKTESNKNEQQEAKSEEKNDVEKQQHENDNNEDKAKKESSNNDSNENGVQNKLIEENEEKEIFEEIDEEDDDDVTFDDLLKAAEEADRAAEEKKNVDEKSSSEENKAEENAVAEEDKNSETKGKKPRNSRKNTPKANNAN